MMASTVYETEISVVRDATDTYQARVSHMNLTNDLL